MFDRPVTMSEYSTFLVVMLLLLLLLSLFLLLCFCCTPPEAAVLLVRLECFAGIPLSSPSCSGEAISLVFIEAVEASWIFWPFCMRRWRFCLLLRFLCIAATWWSIRLGRSPKQLFGMLSSLVPDDGGDSELPGLPFPSLEPHRGPLVVDFCVLCFLASAARAFCLVLMMVCVFIWYEYLPLLPSARNQKNKNAFL